MKRYSLLLPLVAVVFAVACTDATAPANSHALLSPNDPALGALGNPPPPPVDAAVNVCVNGVCAAFDGTYFANGSSLQSALAAAAVGDAEIFNGTAWLLLDNKQPVEFETFSSANARFKTQDGRLSGMGTLVLYDIYTVKIEKVTQFIANPNCGFGQLCADIIFDGTVNGVAFTGGSAQAFDREFCDPSTGEGSFYNCSGIGR